jgi:DNA polymerase III alpha subunit
MTNKFVEYFVEAKRMKIPIHKPDINKSLSEFYATSDGIQAGFCYIKSLGEGAVRELVSKRPYKSFRDFMMKVDGKAINKSAMLALIHSGAFDDLIGIQKREELGKRYDLVLEFLKYKKDKKMEEYPSVPSAILAIGAESEVAGGEIFNSILHLVDINKANEKYSADDKIMKFSSLDKMSENSTIRIMGYVDGFSTFMTKTGKEIGILNIKSGINSTKVMLWSKEVNEYRYLNDDQKILRPGCVVAIRVKRSKDYNGAKTFVLDPKKMDKLI